MPDCEHSGREQLRERIHGEPVLRQCVRLRFLLFRVGILKLAHCLLKTLGPIGVSGDLDVQSRVA